MSGADIDALRRIVGRSNVLVGDDAAGALVDWRRAFHGRALAVARPADTSEVAAVLRWSSDQDVAVTTQGGNTGLSGGATPDDDRPTIVLSMRRMDAIEAVDVDDWTITAQAGATIEALQMAAAGAGRLFAPDWGARGSATIGGAIATDAGGKNVVRYGNLRDQVLGLEVVLADGRVWDGMRSLRKDSSGYDLARLFVGSEGTLGVVTRAVLALRAATPHGRTAMAALTSLDAMTPLFELANEHAAEQLTAFELMPEIGVGRVCATYDLGHPFDARADFYVLVELTSSDPVDERLSTLLERAATRELISDALVAATTEQAERLWTIRDELPPLGLFEHADVGVKMDTAVPIGRMGAFHRAVRDLADELVPGSLVYGFGHGGDGNLHLYVLPVDGDLVGPFVATRPELTRRIDELVFSFGGTLSAEHGVGRELRDRIVGQKPPIEWELMRAVKRAFDPDGRLNPGVLFAEE